MLGLRFLIDVHPRSNTGLASQTTIGVVWTS